MKFTYQDYFGINNYFAVQPNGSYLKVALLIDDTIADILTGTNYTTPEVWAPITRDEFITAYEKAQKCINESFVASCGFVDTDPSTAYLDARERQGRLVTEDEGFE